MVLSQFLENRIKRVCGSILIALALACVLTVLVDKNRESGFLRGDFPAFYAAGVIVKRGLGSELYSQKLQTTVENEFWPSLKGTYYAFAYPPFVAALVLPFAYFPPVAAKLLHVLLMLACIYGTTIVATKSIPAFKNNRLLVFCGILFFGPVLSGVMAGQNNAVSMLLSGLAFGALLSSNEVSRKRNELVAGFYLGLWLFKPHYALLAIFAFFLLGRRFVLIGALVPAVVYAFLAVVVQGITWPAIWLSAASDFGGKDYIVNGHQMVSLFGVAKALRGYFPESDMLVARIVPGVALILSIALWLYFIYFLRKPIRSDGAGLLLTSPMGLKKGEQSIEELRKYSLIYPIIILTAPHVLYYDLGILLLPFLFYLKSVRFWDYSLSFVLLILLISIALTGSREFFAVTPLTIFSFGAVALMLSSQNWKKVKH